MLSLARAATVWAIGTGKVATPEQAQDTHKYIREFIAKRVSQKVADETRISASRDFFFCGQGQAT